MDKRKLVNIILKDLEEVRSLAVEVADNEDASLIEIELALNRAKPLIQEIELLRELAGGPTFVQDNLDEENEEEQEQEETEEDIHYPEPELEITNYNEDAFPENEETPEVEEDFEDEEGEDEEQAEVEEEEEEDKDIVEDEVDEDEPLEIDEDELKEEDWNQEEEAVMEEEQEAPSFKEVKPQPASVTETSEVNSSPRAAFREINIDDDDDDIQPIRVAPSATTNTRPPMREIPKPEDVIAENQENAILGEKFHKERTLNETLGENKTADSKLTHGPITSLKSAIGLNDRFLFIREIFNNNSAKYNEIIDNLDKMEQIQEAVEYLRANLSMQKNEASMKFVELLKRRFSK